MGSLGEPPGAKMKPKWTPKGSPKRSKNIVFSGSDGKLRNVTKIHYLLHFSHIGHPKKCQFGSFFRSQNDIKTERRPNGPKMLPKCLPKASRMDPEPQTGPNRVPNGVPRGSQNDAKIALWGVLGHRCAAKGLRGVSGHPPRLNMEPKWHRNRSTNA